MSNLLGAESKVVVGSAVAVSIGVAALTAYKLRSKKCKEEQENVYETQKSLHEYLVMHYAGESTMLPFGFGPKNALDFPKRCAELCVKHFAPGSGIPNKVLDIGCAVGRSSFELTKNFESVLGIDYSQSFVDACNLLKDQRKMSYFAPIEGDLVENLEVKLDPNYDVQKASFQQGDACNLPLDLGQFGCVLAANLICRLYDPHDFLNRLASLVASGGIVVITSPYTFLREYTPRENWIGGFKTDDGRPFTGFDGLKHCMLPFFDLLAEENMPFLIRETGRKNQWTVAHATVWKRK